MLPLETTNKEMKRIETAHVRAVRESPSFAYTTLAKAKRTHTHTLTHAYTHTHTHDVAENNKEGKERLLVFSSSSSFWFSLLLVFPIYIFSSTFPSFSYPLFHLYSIPRIPQHTLCIYIKFLEVFTRKIFLLAYNY